MAKRGRGAVCVCAGDMQLICPKAETERVREGKGRQLHCSTAGSLCACRITNFPGDQGQQQQRQPPLSMPHAVLCHATLSGRFHWTQTESVCASSGIIVKRSICPSGSRLQGVVACCCSCCRCNVCNFLINAIMSWLFSWPRLMLQCLPASAHSSRRTTQASPATVPAQLLLLLLRLLPNCTHVCNLFSRHKNFLTGKWALN